MPLANEAPGASCPSSATSEASCLAATDGRNVLSRRAQSLDDRVIRIAPIMVRVVHHDVDKHR